MAKKPRVTKKKASEMTDKERVAEFESVAALRMTRLLKGIDGIGRLSGARYQSTPQHLERMQSAIRDALQNAFGRLAGKVVGKSGFQFGE